MPQDLKYFGGLGLAASDDRPRTSVIDNGVLVQSVREGFQPLPPSGLAGSPVIGYSDRTSPASIAATLRAAEVAKSLPSNQPTREQGQNFLQGLENVFRPQMKAPEIDGTGPFPGVRSAPNPSMEVEALLRDNNWNTLYSADPDRANRVYRARTGMTFDEALEARKDQQDFVQKTVQSMVASGKLRQGVTGDWEEQQEVADTSPGALPGATKKDWAPASFQTKHMVDRMGGGKGIYGRSFNNLSIAETDDALRRAGITDPAERKNWIQTNLKSKEAAMQSAHATAQQATAKTGNPLTSPVYLLNEFYPENDIDINPISQISKWMDRRSKERQGNYPLGRVTDPRTPSRRNDADLIRALTQ